MAEHNGRTPLYIIDASVIIKWFLEKDEEWLEEALALQMAYDRREANLAFPEYGVSEVLNLMGRTLPREKALYYFSQLLLFEIPTHYLTLDIASYAFEIMKDFPGVSFYDAGYHALAMLEKGTFITADRHYYKKTRKKGHIMLLKDFGKKER